MVISRSEDVSIGFSLIITHTKSTHGIGANFGTTYLIHRMETFSE
jgi:hypothetical protein